MVRQTGSRVRTQIRLCFILYLRNEATLKTNPSLFNFTTMDLFWAFIIYYTRCYIRAKSRQGRFLEHLVSWRPVQYSSAKVFTRLIRIKQFSTVNRTVEPEEIAVKLVEKQSAKTDFRRITGKAASGIFPSSWPTPRIQLLFHLTFIAVDGRSATFAS